MPMPSGSGPNRATRRYRTDTRRISRGLFEAGIILILFGTDPHHRQTGQSGEVAHRRRQQAHRRRPRAGAGRHAQDLQLRGLSQPSGHQELRGQVPRQDRGLDVQRRRRGHHQASQRGRLRHLQRQLHRDQPTGDRRTAASAQPQLPAQHLQRVADVHQPVVRPGLAVHRAVHHLHHRNGLAHRPSASRHRCAQEPLRSVVGSQVQGQDRDHRRLAHRHGDGAAETGHYRRQHVVVR